MSARSGKRLVEDQDELEYNITFPTATDSDATAKEPVVYLLGWAAASDKVLAKYSSIYEKEGCITIRYIHPKDDLFFLSSSTVDSFRETAEKLVQLLEDYDLQENPIFVHCFSNNGACVYRYIADVFHTQRTNMQGIIFDSGPSALAVSIGIKAIYSFERQNGLYAFLSYLGRFFCHNISYMFWSVFSGKRAPNFFKDLQDSTNHLWPHLFLYSTNDGVIPAKHILEMYEARKQAGANFVKKHDFLDSPHVNHLRFHKAVYSEKCISFLDKCLTIYEEDQSFGYPERNVSQVSSVDPLPLRSYDDSSPSTSGQESALKHRSTSQSETRI